MAPVGQGQVTWHLGHKVFKFGCSDVIITQVRRQSGKDFGDQRSQIGLLIAGLKAKPEVEQPARPARANAGLNPNWRIGQLARPDGLQPRPPHRAAE